MLGLLPRHRLLIALLVASALIAAVCAKLNASGDLTVAAATTHVFVDYPDASIVDRRALPQDPSNLQARAELYARLMTTTPVLDAIAKRAGVPPSQISGTVDLSGDVPVQFTQAGSEQHASQLVASKQPYRLELQPDPIKPILSIYADAPSADQALRLANSAVSGLDDYLRTVAAQQAYPVRELPQLRQLGAASGGVTNSGAKIEIAGLTFITVFALSFAVLFLIARRPWRRRKAPRAVPDRSHLTRSGLGDWPRTTRLLPWSVAGLIAMFWLTPFDRIQLTLNAPVNITLDRIVLPIVAAIWIIAFTAGDGAAPRIRITRVHLAIAVFVAIAFLSTVLDAHYLNHTNELMLSLKRLPLLVSYVSVFLIVSSSVRRSEVPAFMTFTLVLAVIVGLGVIYEYKFHDNLFVSWASKIFIGPFKVGSGDLTNASVLDSLGRRTVEGPAAYGVELVTMLSIALPIAVLAILKSKTRRQYILYGLATIVLLYAMLSTDRKSALVAPAAVFLTLAYFRRRQLLSLAPLGLVLVVMVVALSPAAIRHILTQYTAANANHVATVDSRTANFDAIRPDLWSHLLFGRGWGTYAPPTDRIIDSEILLPLAEVGVLGLVAFLSIPVSIILAGRKAATRAESSSSSPVLCGVAAAVCFLVVSTLYSVMSLPHGPDVFLYVAGLTVVLIGPEAMPSAEVALTRRREAVRGRRGRARPHAHPPPQSRVPAG